MPYPAKFSEVEREEAGSWSCRALWPMLKIVVTTVKSYGSISEQRSNTIKCECREDHGLMKRGPEGVQSHNEAMSFQHEA